MAFFDSFGSMIVYFILEITMSYLTAINHCGMWFVIRVNPDGAEDVLIGFATYDECEVYALG